MKIWDQVLQNAADVLHKRDPMNAFFRWLSEGASDGLADLIVSQVPKDGNHPMHQWSFVREDSSSMGRIHGMGLYLLDRPPIESAGIDLDNANACSSL